MSRAEPLSAVERAHNYWLQRWRPELTPRQRRRVQHKANRALRVAYEREQHAQPT